MSDLEAEWEIRTPSHAPGAVSPVLADIVERYKSRGLKGKRLVAALARHARVIAGEDADVAYALVSLPVRVLEARS